MIKGFIKELIIALLLCLAIILVLGILLYNYNPSSKTLPDKVAYTTPEKIKEELNNLDGVDEILKDADVLHHCLGDAHPKIGKIVRHQRCYFRPAKRALRS